MSIEKKSRDQAIEELSLMLMYLTRFQDNNEYCRYLEPNWKGYELDVLNVLEEKGLLYQPKKSKCVYLSEEGKDIARKLIMEYQFSDKDIREKYEFRNIARDEWAQAAEIEQICFPPNEACKKEHMKARIEKAPEMFLVAIDKKTGKLVGFLNGLATDEMDFRDEFFQDANLYNPNGRNVMLLGLDVIPEYRKQGIARELVFEYLRRERNKGRSMLILTCLQAKVKMYQKMGFVDRGVSASTWGGEEWHEMVYTIGI